MTGPSERAVEAPDLLNVRLTLCRACLEGKGGECHSPGCALWMNSAPDIPVTEYEVVPDAGPALGEDASVRLGDVLDVLRTYYRESLVCSDFGRAIDVIESACREGRL
jgi:hypothetical protein